MRHTFPPPFKGILLAILEGAIFQDDFPDNVFETFTRGPRENKI